MERALQSFLQMADGRDRTRRRRTSNGEFPGALQAAALAGTMQQLIDDLPEHIALIGEDCEILAVNRAWNDSLVERGFIDALPGYNLRAFLTKRLAEPYAPAADALAALDDIISGRRAFREFTYNGGERWSHRNFRVCFNRISLGNRNLILLTRFDETEISELRRAKEDMAHSLIEGQAQERRRMARELHDSTSQLLTGISLLLGRLERNLPDSDALGLLEEMHELVSETQQSIRSISYLAVPPSLEKLGLVGAMKSLAEGFARRTGLEISFEVQGKEVALGGAAENALYRTLQEALSNVYRHAAANLVQVALCYRDRASHLTITDDGIGISSETLAGSGTAGVGLASMRTRLSEVGGRLSLRRLFAGTAVIASVRKRLGSRRSELRHPATCDGGPIEFMLI